MADSDMTMMAMGAAALALVGTGVSMALFNNTTKEEDEGPDGFAVEEPAKKKGKKDKKKAKKAKKAAPSPAPEAASSASEAEAEDTQDPEPEPEPEKVEEVEVAAKKPKKKKKKAKKAVVVEAPKVDTAAAAKLAKQLEKQKKKAEKQAQYEAKQKAEGLLAANGWTTVASTQSTKPVVVLAPAGAGEAPAPVVTIDLGECAGMIIGKKGANIQHIQSTSGANIDIDKTSNQAIIKGGAANVAAAAKMINDVLAREGSKTSGQLQVPKDMHRKIVGQGFQGIRDIQDETNTRIEVPKRDDPSDILTISGQADGIEHAKRLILTKIAKFNSNSLHFPYGHYPLGGKGVIRLFLANKGAKLMEVQTGSKADINIDRAKEEFVINGEESAYVRDAFTMISEILNTYGKVHEFKVADARMAGRIIGAGGEQIRNLESKSGAQIDRVDSLNFKVTGTAANVAKAQTMINAVLSGEADDIFLKAGEVKKELDIPRHCVGSIIGQKGAQIRALEESTKASIRVDRDSVGDTIKVKVFGQPSTVEAAIAAIEAIVATVKDTVAAKAQSAEQLAAKIELTGEEFNQDKFAEAQVTGQSWGQAADGDDADAW